MRKLLHIIATPRKGLSRTLRISESLIRGLKLKHPATAIDELNLFEEALPELNVTRVGGKYMLMSGQELTPDADKSWEEIKKHIERFLSADVIVISTPMWNFSVPYKLKHYLDVILQPGFTFKYGANGPEGLATGRKVFVVSTHGGDYGENSPAKSYDQLTPYLKQIFGFIGITDPCFLSAQPMDAAGEEVRESRINEAIEKGKEILRTF